MIGKNEQKTKGGIALFLKRILGETLDGLARGTGEGINIKKN